MQLDPDYPASPVDYSGAFHAGRGPVPIATADAAVLWPEDLASINETNSGDKRIPNSGDKRIPGNEFRGHNTNY